MQRGGGEGGSEIGVREVLEEVVVDAGGADAEELVDVPLAQAAEGEARKSAAKATAMVKDRRQMIFFIGIILPTLVSVMNCNRTATKH